MMSSLQFKFSSVWKNEPDGQDHKYTFISLLDLKFWMSLLYIFMNRQNFSSLKSGENKILMLSSFIVCHMTNFNKLCKNYNISNDIGQKSF